MKYCVKCGTLLEDSHEICIGCGADVSTPENYTLFPPDVQEQIEAENAERKERGGIIAAIVIVFILLVAALAIFVGYNVYSVQNKSTVETVEPAEETVAEEMAEEAEEVEEAADAATAEAPETLNTDLISDVKTTPEADSASENNSNREVKDTEGFYYTYNTLKDAGGNTVFTTMYPEDFAPVAQNVDFSLYSTKFPGCVTFIAGNQEGNVQLTYISPQHFWHRKSSKGKSRDNERNIFDYMMYYKYDGAQGYIEALIKQSYTDIKSFKLIETVDVDTQVRAKLMAFSESYTETLLGDIGDYASIASDAVYAPMEAQYEANIFKYEATTKKNETIYMDFYVPMVANTLSYVTEIDNDQGDVIEWLPLEVVAYEAGNEDLYVKYQEAFEVFINNTRPTKQFLYENQEYSKEIKAAIGSSSSGQVELKSLDANKLKSYNDKYKEDAELDAYYEGLNTFFSAHAEGAAEFKNDELTVHGTKDDKVCFYNKETKKVFISTAEDEYPGDTYEELTTQ